MNSIRTLLLCALVAIMSCSRQDTPEPQQDCTLSYGDTIFHYKNQVGDYTIRPVQSSSVPGIYRSTPVGLEMDSTTGVVNISQSEAGLRYKITFTPNNSNKTCETKFIVSGIDYRDSIHVLAANDSMALPIYDATPGKPLPCGDDDDDDDGCEFDDDEDDDDGDGDADEPPPGQDARSQGLDVSKANAQINLKQTLANGTFGAVPVSGAHKDFDIYYRLNDVSAKALNRITVRVYYFERRADIPADLLQELGDKRDALLRKSEFARVAPGGLFELYRRYAPKRPPYIIIVRS